LAIFASIPSPGPGKFGNMLGSQMVLMQSIHGGPLNGPTLTGIDALRIIGYWWRQRGRFWKGWVKALNRLKASGIAPTTASAFKVFTPAQSEIVWECAREAVADMKRIKSAQKLAPGVFSDAQSLADAKAVARRYLAGNFTGKIPPALKPAKTRPPKTTTKPATRAEAQRASIWPPTREAMAEAQRLVPPIQKIPDDLFERIPRIKRPRFNISGKVGWLILAALIAREMRDKKR